MKVKCKFVLIMIFSNYNIHLDKPICKSRDLETIAVGHGEQVFVPCRVSANPPEVEFHWYFNSSDNKVWDLHA